MVFQKKRCKNTRIFRDNLQENGKSKRRKGRRWENGVQKGRVTAMSGSFGIRTDLAVESKEKYEKDNVEIKGVAIHEEYEESLDLNTTVVRIQTEQGARVMEKPRGTYITMEAPNLIVPDEDYHREISVALAHHLRELLHLEKEKSILVVGLGNREITPDALGPRVIQNLKITRHIVKEYGKAGMGKERVHQISSLVPGVMAKTGMESQEIISGVVTQTHPDLVLVIDALAARSIKRLNRTIQISNAGINPGSGVGNYRNAIQEENLGVPVIALGVPTVVDAATIVQDAVFKDCGMEDQDFLDRKEKITGAMDELYNMYVTGKDVDYEIRQISHIICNAIHLALEL